MTEQAKQPEVKKVVNVSEALATPDNKQADFGGKVVKKGDRVVSNVGLMYDMLTGEKYTEEERVVKKPSAFLDSQVEAGKFVIVKD